MATEAQPSIEPILSVVDVTIDFRGVHALDGVSFDVAPGGVTALIGPNGAGKTTLFNCVTGLSRPRGKIRFSGRDITDEPAHRRAALGLGRTFQTPAVVDGSSVLDNVLLGSEAQVPVGVTAGLLRPRSVRAANRTATDQAVDLLERFEILHLRDRPVESLPHGVRRRVEILRALMAHPSLLLLDEPAAGLDLSEARALLAGLGRLAVDRGFTILLVEHSVALVLEVAHHVVVLDAGRLIGEGSPQRIRSDPVVIAAYLGSDPDEAAAEAGDRGASVPAAGQERGA